LYGAKTGTLRKVGEKFQERFEMWCWGRKYKISSTDRVKNEVLHRAKEDKDILHAIKGSTAICIGHILCRNCLLRHVVEGKNDGRMGLKGRERISKHLLNGLKETTDY
jgi:hypothetical protein